MPNKFHDPGNVSPKHTPKNSDRKSGKPSNIDRPKFGRMKDKYIDNSLLNKAKGFKTVEDINCV